MPLQSTSGTASYDAFGGGAAAKVNYIEDCFVSWLSTGNGTSRTITGPDMTTGGLSITKSRSTATGWHFVDTARGAGNSLSSNTTAANASESTGVTAFTATGTSIGAAAEYNTSGATYVDYLLKKQPKFFDVVTWTGDGTTRNISHNLGSVPGCVIIKRTDTTSNWMVSHRGSVDTWAILNGTNAFTSSAAAGTIGADGYCYLSGSTDTYFRVVAGATGYAAVNASGGTYVAYLFAHNAGGFGLTGTDNVISCGSFTTDGSGAVSVDLGYEPQWILYKKSGESGDWQLSDSMRGLNQTQLVRLVPNTSGAETTFSDFRTLFPTATGFGISTGLGASKTYIYIAIRRGPMKVPTSGTSVFSPIASTGTTGTAQTTDFPVDLQINRDRANTGNNFTVDRLRGVNTTAVNTGQPTLWTNATNAENSNTTTRAWGNTGFQTPSVLTSLSAIYWNFRRAPSFFDEVCYTGTGSATTINHNLGVAPEMIITKARNVGRDWNTYHSALGNTKAILLSTTGTPLTSINYWNNTSPTSSVFSVASETNRSGDTMVAYLFATCAGVSKVGSYTGTGTGNPQTIDCGFTAGARFVLIKKTSATGNWWVWDSARGIVASVDPYLALEQTFAENFNGTSDSVDTHSTGFIVNENAQNNVNSTGATYIFLAIA